MNGRPKLREDDRTVHEADGREEQEDIEVRAERTWSTRPGLLSSAIQCIADWQQRVTASNKLYERSNQSHSSGKMPVHHSMCDAILATAINIKAGGAEGGGREERGGRDGWRTGARTAADLTPTTQANTPALGKSRRRKRRGHMDASHLSAVQHQKQRQFNYSGTACVCTDPQGTHCRAKSILGRLRASDSGSQIGRLWRHISHTYPSRKGIVSGRRARQPFSKRVGPGAKRQMSSH